MSASPAIPRYGVIGNPIAHSKSPRIHALFADAAGQQLSYERILSSIDRFAETVHEFRGAGGLGLSVTAPFKLECLALAASASMRAQAAGAANTLAWRDDQNRWAMAVLMAAALAGLVFLARSV